MSWRAPVEQLGQGPRPVGALEAVLVLDPDHRHALAGRGEIVHRGGDGLLTFGDGGQGHVPFGLADDRWAGKSHHRVLLRTELEPAVGNKPA